MAAVVFSSTLFSRAVDPLVPLMATDLGVDPKTVALLSTAFTLPYALSQPLIGSMADHFGKTRVMNGSILIVSLAALVCAMATNFPLLVAMRIAAGLVAGGLFPVALAMIGDLVPINQRQVAIGQMLAVGLTGNLLGASLSGVIGDLVGWRGVFVVLGTFSSIMTVTAFFAFRGSGTPQRGPFNLDAILKGYRSVFADPRAKVCFSSVFLEGIFIQGQFPYIALMLLAAGEARASFAGLIIAAFGVGGVIYSLLVSVFLASFSERALMMTGGVLAAVALVLVALNFPWYAMVAIFGLMGFGFYLLHGCIHVHVTELSQTARGAATAMHSCTFYLGQALGPVLYGFSYSHGLLPEHIAVGAMVVLGVSLACARWLRHRSTASH